MNKKAISISLLAATVCLSACGHTGATKEQGGESVSTVQSSVLDTSDEDAGEAETEEVVEEQTNDEIVSSVLNLKKEPDTNIVELNCPENGGFSSNGLSEGYFGTARYDFDGDGDDEILVTAIVNGKIEWNDQDCLMEQIYMLEKNGDSWEIADTLPNDRDTESGLGSCGYGTPICRTDIFYNKENGHIFIDENSYTDPFLYGQSWSLYDICYKNNELCFDNEPIDAAASDGFVQYVTKLTGVNDISEESSQHYLYDEIYDKFMQTGLNKVKEGISYTSPLYSANEDMIYVAGYDYYADDYFAIKRFVNGNETGTVKTTVHIDFSSEYVSSKGKISNTAKEDIEENGDTDSTDGMTDDEIVSKLLNLSIEPSSTSITLNNVGAVYGEGMKEGIAGCHRGDYDGDGQDEILALIMVKGPEDSMNGLGPLKSNYYEQLVMLERSGDTWSVSAKYPENAVDDENTIGALYNAGIFAHSDVFIGKDGQTIFADNVVYMPLNANGLSWSLYRITYDGNAFMIAGDIIRTSGSSEIIGYIDYVYNSDSYASTGLNKPQGDMLYYNTVYGANSGLQYVAGYNYYADDYNKVFDWITACTPQYEEPLHLDFYEEYHRPAGQIDVLYD